MEMTENMLFQAFDLQRFAENERLCSVIDRSHARMKGRELSDDDLDLVAAAGIPEMMGMMNDDPEQKSDPWEQK